MEKRMLSNARHFLLVLLAFVLAAGCARGPQATPNAASTLTATLDPLASINCPRQTKNTYLCYAGERLLGDNDLLEKAASDFCLLKLSRCSLFIWKDNASVGQAYPLTDADTRSLIATYLWNWVTYDGCYKAFQDGKTVYSSGNCSQ